MAAIYLHDHKEFPTLLRILESETGILAGLIEKDYWIMHSLYGPKKQGYDFQLKGGTSLSKGFGLIDRFSEDIDLQENRFPEDDLKIPINENEAFLLSDKGVRERFQKRYELTKSLYYKGQPLFVEILKHIHQYIDRL